MVRNQRQASQGGYKLEGLGEVTSKRTTGQRRAGRLSTALSLGLQSLGFACIGVMVIFVQADATAHSRMYASTPQFKVWATLIIGIITSLPAVWRIGVDLLRRLGLNPRHVLRSWSAPALIGVGLVVGAAVFAGEYARGNTNGSLYYGGIVRIGVIYALGIIATAPAFLVMWECYRQLADDDGALGQDADARITHLLLVRECLLSALTTVGLLVSAGVLATGAQRQAVLANARYAGTYPSAYVLIWGLGFSALLIVNFLPAFRRLTRIANAIIDAALPVLPPGSDGWRERLQERKDLAELLKVTSGSKDVITSAILVAGPLISSAFSMFLPSGSS